MPGVRCSALLGACLTAQPEFTTVLGFPDAIKLDNISPFNLSHHILKSFRAVFEPLNQNSISHIVFLCDQRRVLPGLCTEPATPLNTGKKTLRKPNTNIMKR